MLSGKCSNKLLTMFYNQRVLYKVDDQLRTRHHSRTNLPRYAVPIFHYLFAFILYCNMILSASQNTSIDWISGLWWSAQSTWYPLDFRNYLPWHSSYWAFFLSNKEQMLHLIPQGCPSLVSLLQPSELVHCTCLSTKKSFHTSSPLFWIYLYILI